MKNARAKRAKLLFFIVKYAILRHSCGRRRRGSLSYLFRTKDVGDNWLAGQLEGIASEETVVSRRWASK